MGIYTSPNTTFDHYGQNQQSTIILLQYMRQRFYHRLVCLSWQCRRSELCQVIKILIPQKHRQRLEKSLHNFE